MARLLRLLAPGLSLWIWALDVCSAGFLSSQILLHQSLEQTFSESTDSVVNMRHGQLVDMTTHLQTQDTISHKVLFLMLCHSTCLSLYSIWTRIMMPYWLNSLLLPNCVFHHNQYNTLSLTISTSRGHLSMPDLDVCHLTVSAFPGMSLNTCWSKESYSHLTINGHHLYTWFLRRLGDPVGLPSSEPCDYSRPLSNPTHTGFHCNSPWLHSILKTGPCASLPLDPC